MFEIIEKENENELELLIKLPVGKSQSELVKESGEFVEKNSPKFFGKDVFLSGRVTTAMCLVLGHKLSHITKSVSILDPKENTFVLCIFH